LIVALLLPGGTGWTVQAAPPAQEAPPGRLPYDGPFDLPRLPGDATQREPGQALTAPEYVDWSKLVFQSARNNSDWEIYAARGDSSDQVNISNHAGMDVHPRLNRGATRVVFASNRHGAYDLFTMNADGGGQARIVDSPGDDVFPAWSPGGNRITFQAYRDGQPEIYVANADGSGQARLTNHGDYDGQPAWSPDGSQIAFVRRESGGYRIWAMNADGSNQRPLSNQPYSADPAWSPDGSQIAYDADGNGDGWQEIWLMNADGSNQREVYDPPEGNTDAWVGSWSPDGRYVAFTRISFVYNQGQWYWTVAYLDASDSTQPWNTIRLSSNGADWNPAWASTDGQAPASRVLALPTQSPGPFTVNLATPYWGTQ
jgi:Tol biopolymer transport system component